MKKTIFTFAILLMGFGAFAQSNSNDFKAELINYIQIQSEGAMGGALDQMASMIPADKKEAFKKEVKDEMKSLYKQVADIYIETIGEEDLQKMLDFYNTPAGERILEKTPMLTERSMQLSQTWAMQLQPIMQKYMN